MPPPPAAPASGARPLIQVRRITPARAAPAPVQSAPSMDADGGTTDWMEMRREPLEQGKAAKKKREKGGILSRFFDGAQASESLKEAEFEESDASLAEAPAAEGGVDTGAEGLLSRQLANGLWEGTGEGSEPVRQARATALALLTLLREGITSSHPLHGAQVKKAVEALLSLAASLSGDAQVAELALGVAWLAAAGPRTRGRIEQAAKPLAGLNGRLGNEVALREHVDTLAAR